MLVVKFWLAVCNRLYRVCCDEGGRNYPEGEVDLALIYEVNSFET